MSNENTDTCNGAAQESKEQVYFREKRDILDALNVLNKLGGRDNPYSPYGRTIARLEGTVAGMIIAERHLEGVADDIDKERIDAIVQAKKHELASEKLAQELEAIRKDECNKCSFYKDEAKRLDGERLELKYHNKVLRGEGSCTSCPHYKKSKGIKVTIKKNDNAGSEHHCATHGV